MPGRFPSDLIEDAMSKTLKTAGILFLAAWGTGCARTKTATGDGGDAGDLRAAVEVSAGQPIGQLRAVPLQLGPGRPKALLAVFAGDAEVDPYEEMFFFPKDTLKLMAFTAEGKVLWKREMGRGLVPGIWFCPVFPFDLDGDGADEVWFVNNTDDDHPLSLQKRRLERLDGATGRTTGHWPWPSPDRSQGPSHLYRNFILGGHAGGKPVLVTAQGTYGPMKLQGWNPDMSKRWEHAIAKDSPGARGSHMCAVADLDGDGVDEVMWGERCIELGSGKERFCADRDTWGGHSDVAQPVWDPGGKRWVLYTCRESGNVAPRVAAFDAAGRRLWGDLDQGHIDVGWVARLHPDGRRTALAIRIGGKSAGPQGFARKGVEEFACDVFTGEKRTFDFSLFGTLPVDVDGDGIHELVRGLSGGDGSVLDGAGRALGRVEGAVALAAKVLDLPGEQIVTWTPDGRLRVWAHARARDNEAARARYEHPFYKANRRLTATGYNLVNLGGL